MRILYFLILSTLFLQITNSFAAVRSFFRELQSEKSITQPCTCDCHSRIYSYKECSTCAHSGGKFYANNAQLENRIDQSGQNETDENE